MSVWRALVGWHRFRRGREDGKRGPAGTRPDTPGHPRPPPAALTPDSARSARPRKSGRRSSTYLKT